jgi:hypothetical protein
MIRAYDLSSMTEKANQDLNDPDLRLISLNISCSAETAYTVASMRFAPCEKRERKFNRYLERFIVLGNKNPDLDRRLSDPNTRLLKQYIFPTAEGTVVVIDYQVRKGRKVED